MKTYQVLYFSLFFFQTILVFAAKVDTLEVRSEVMQINIKAAVVLPETYSDNTEEYPVLYLLHGGTGDYRDWLTKTEDPKLLQNLSDQYNLIIVTPDGGPASYYFDSPVDKSSQYETFIAQELINEIDGIYRTISNKKGRVIAGLSMGGHGAVYIATKHPELYSAAGSMSGVMNIDPSTWIVPEEFAQSRIQRFSKLLGIKENSPESYRPYTAVGMTDKIKENDVKLIIDCGVDDFLIETNRDLHRRLLENGTPHEYIERPGAHTWEYWGNALPFQVLFMYKVLRDNGVLISRK